MKYKNRGKEAAPVNTINECRRCLEKLGVMVYEEWMEPVKGVFSEIGRASCRERVSLSV